jgi:(p)ppGpp synthase/HD superfamily hydrolase
VVLTSVPSFPDQLPLSQAAWEFARDVHGGQTQADGDTAFIEHPREVARLLLASGAPDELVAAGLLHDTLERTPITRSDLRSRFGPEVAALVGAVTEQASIRPYRQRKAALRKQATESGDQAAILFAADKLARVREDREHLARSMRGGGPHLLRRLDHYIKSLHSLEAVIPHHPLVRELRRELMQLTLAGRDHGRGR